MERSVNMNRSVKLVQTEKGCYFLKTFTCGFTAVSDKFYGSVERAVMAYKKGGG